MKPAAFLLCCLWVLAAPAFGAIVHESVIHRREIAIAKTLRCTVCQAESLAESQASIAQDMRKLIREKLRAGETPAQIRAYFVSRYGDYILLKPPFDPLGAILWIWPFALFAGLGGVAAVMIRRRSHAPLPPPPPELAPEDRARIEALTRQE
ncbi:MAG TPA: cytochrome c-type biogenesis protein [Acidiferrobacter sp.]|nr:cytochrome c-type biogenesis protein [Acidiferrobacter sp.]